MNKCSCFRENTSPYYGNYTGRCVGTREQDGCMCNGDESKCDFYPDKREKAKKPMSTAEMWLQAQKDGKSYFNEKEDIIYNKNIGFVYTDNSDAEQLSECDTRTEILSSVGWVQKEELLTKAEAENKFNIKIIG